MMSTGTVKWFSSQKGFGFITPDDGGEDLFVHQTEIRSEGFRTLREGQRVEFQVESGEDGRQKAIEVVGIASSNRSDRGRARATSRQGGTGGHYGGERGGGGYGIGRDGSGGEGGGGGGGVECYSCGRIGHLARDCYRRGAGGGGRSRGFRGGGRGRGRSLQGSSGGRGGGGACYNCGEEGHFARDCTVDLL